MKIQVSATITGKARIKTKINIPDGTEPEKQAADWLKRQYPRTYERIIDLKVEKC